MSSRSGNLFLTLLSLKSVRKTVRHAPHPFLLLLQVLLLLQCRDAWKRYSTALGAGMMCLVVRGRGHGGGVCVKDNLITFFSFFLREKQLYNLVLVHIKCRETTSCCPPCSCAYRLQLSFIFSHSNQTASHKVYS